MHYLARNFAAKLKEELIASNNEIPFGETMSYNKIYMGMIGGEYVTLEEFVEGTFRKCINNNGSICESGHDRTEKARTVSTCCCPIQILRKLF